MKKNILSAIALSALVGMSMVSTSCSDADDVKDLTLSQTLSATNLSMTANANLSVIVTWDQMFNASSYELTVSQDETFADVSQQVYKEIITAAYRKGGSCSVTLPKLDPETKYFARLKAIGNAPDSKFVYANVTTVAEQILSPIAKADITSNSVVINWTPGEVVKAVEIINANGEIVNTLTPTDSDNQNGQMTIDGLTAHTSYTIRLVSNTDKTRGHRMFTTLLDLSNAITIPASAAADGSWVATLEAGLSGQVFAFEEAEYLLPEEVKFIKIKSDIVIAAKDITKMPTLHGAFQIENAASPYFYYLKLTLSDNETAAPLNITDQCINYTAEGTAASLDIEGCEISGYVKGLVYINKACKINEINIKENYIHNVICNGGDFIDARVAGGGWNTLNFKDNTVVDCFTARDFIRNDKDGCINNIENNTFYNCGNSEANYRLFYTRGAGSAHTFTNNIVSGFNNKRGFYNNATWGTITTKDNVYFDCKNLTELAEGNTENLPFFDENGQVLSSTPFVDAEKGDFRLTDPNLRLKQVGPSYWYEQDVEE